MRTKMEKLVYAMALNFLAENAMLIQENCAKNIVFWVFVAKITQIY